MKKLIVLISVISISCSKDEKGDDQMVQIFNSSNELILEEKNVQIDKRGENSIFIRFSEENKIKLKALSSARIGEDILIELNGGIAKKVKVLDVIENGIIRLDRVENAGPIFDNEAEAVESLLPDK